MTLATVPHINVVFEIIIKNGIIVYILLAECGHRKKSVIDEKFTIAVLTQAWFTNFVACNFKLILQQYRLYRDITIYYTEYMT